MNFPVISTDPVYSDLFVLYQVSQVLIQETAFACDNVTISSVDQWIRSTLAGYYSVNIIAYR